MRQKKSESERHYLTQETYEIVFKKVAPQRRACPSPPSPWAPPCQDFSPPLQLFIILIVHGQAGTRAKRARKNFTRMLYVMG